MEVTATCEYSAVVNRSGAGISSVYIFIKAIKVIKQHITLEVNSCLVSQEIPRLSWNPKVHYHVHNNPPLDPILSHMDPIHTLTFTFFVHFNILLQHTPTFFKWSLSFRSSDQNSAHISHLSCMLATCPPISTSLN